MAIQDLTVAQRAAQRFAEAVRQEPAVKRLWVWSQRGYLEPDEEYVELWLLTDVLDEAADKRLSTAMLSLNEWFPDVEFRVHVLPPGFYDPRGPLTAVRADVTEVPLQPA